MVKWVSLYVISKNLLTELRTYSKNIYEGPVDTDCGSRGWAGWREAEGRKVGQL